MSHTVIYSDSNSASLAINPADFANPAAVAVAISISRLVPDLVDVLLSLTLLTGVALHPLDLGSFAYLLYVYLFYFPISLFLNKTVLAFLIYLAILRILYRPIKAQVRLRILI